MNAQPIRLFVAVTAILAGSAAFAQTSGRDTPWRAGSDFAGCVLRPEGKSPYLVLEPGIEAILEQGNTKVQITILDDVKAIGNVATRAVERKVWNDGELHEVAKRYFAICADTGDIYYFGEDVECYARGQVVRRNSALLAGNKVDLDSLGAKAEEGTRPGDCARAGDGLG